MRWKCPAVAERKRGWRWNETLGFNGEQPLLLLSFPYSHVRSRPPNFIHDCRQQIVPPSTLSLYHPHRNFTSIHNPMGERQFAHPVPSVLYPYKHRHPHAHRPVHPALSTEIGQHLASPCQEAARTMPPTGSASTSPQRPEV